MPSEFQFLENLRNRYSLSKIGDDCAVLPKDSRTDLVVTTDLLVEDIDFRLDWTRPEFIGHKALAVSLSDVAAMGAKPVWSMVSIGVPEKIWRSDFVDEFYEGYMNLAKKYEVELVGGDVSKTPDKIVVDSMAAGEIGKGKAILRSGAKAGDVICVTGELGGAAAALKLLEKGERYGKSDFDNLLLRQLKPTPRVEIGRFLSENSLATAMIDLSDGLAGDLHHICRLSRVGASLFEDKIPAQSPNDKFFPVFNLSDSEEILFFGGEDFELLFTIGQSIFFDLQNEFEKRGISRIGRVTANTEIIELSGWKNSRILDAKGFRHF
ncbi:MAG TPA: thiamine-phosphate kinase [Pyrinomonadaceae bacterium]